MAKAARPYQIFAKPIGPVCNLRCDYCYYLEKKALYPGDKSFRMPEDLLKEYIIQHMETSPGPVVGFSWHGGEPTLLGLDYFRKIVDLQRKHLPPHKRIFNGIQTNGTLLDEEWGRFLAAEGFGVGISLDGPEHLHDGHRRTIGGNPSHNQTMRGYELLHKHQVPCDLLCVVHAGNVDHPIEVYRFFMKIKARYIGFLPLVEIGDTGGVSFSSVGPEPFGDFLCAVFDEWVQQDIGRVKVQIFEEAAAAALGVDHSLCIFKPTCGDVPVLEHNGDFFACDHFVDKAHLWGNIRETPLKDLVEDPRQAAFGRIKQDSLPRQCTHCEVLSLCNGGCPKDRILLTPDGEAGLNYLCAGYKRFFLHCRPFLAQLSALHAQQVSGSANTSPSGEHAPAHRKTGRNDPCPCGSGRKYKKCCMGK